MCPTGVFSDPAARVRFRARGGLPCCGWHCMQHSAVRASRADRISCRHGAGSPDRSTAAQNTTLETQSDSATLPVVFCPHARRGSTAEETHTRHGAVGERWKGVCGQGQSGIGPQTASTDVKHNADGQPEMLRPADLQRMLNLSRSAFFQALSTGRILAPTRFGPRSPRWVRSTVTAWIADGAPHPDTWRKAQKVG